MFAPVTIGMLIAAAVVIVLHLLGSFARRGADRGPTRGLGALGWLVYLVLIASTAVLAVTSLYSIFTDGHMRGWMLWVHLFAAGAFVVTLVLVSLLWASACDMCAPPGGGPPEDRPLRFGALTRLSFWLFIVAGVVSLGSMFLSMLTLLNTNQIELAMDVHRYSGVAVVAAAVIHLYSVSLGRLAAR